MNAASSQPSDVAVPIAIAVVEHQDCFLIGRRPAGVPLAGLWEFPGGKVRAGESAEAAAVRECREEADVAVRICDSFPAEVCQYEHGRVRLHFFLCAPQDARPVPRKPFRWVARQDLDRFEFPAGNRRILHHLQQDSPRG